MTENDADKLARFLYEAGHLKNLVRSGWLVAGIKNPESVADHSFRVAVMAALLAKLEGADVGRAVTLAVFHDMAEARTGDLHKMAQRYLEGKDGAEKAGNGQAASLPPALSGMLSEAFSEIHRKESLEAAIVADADRLDCLFQALEYRACGFPTSEWVENSKNSLLTGAARSIAHAALGQNPFKWWEGLTVT